MNMVKCYSHLASRFQDYKISRLQDYKITRFQDFKITRLQDFKISRLQDFKISRFQDYKITRFQDFKIFKHTKYTKFWKNIFGVEIIKLKFKKKIRLKDNDMDNKMPSPAMFCTNKVNKMRECDKDWKAKEEIQSSWEKKYILTYKPTDSIYTSRMIFRYIEDYEKMKKIDNIYLYLLSKGQFDFIYELEEETKKLLELVKKCNFLNIDYDDGIVFENKFLDIFYFLMI